MPHPFSSKADSLKDRAAMLKSSRDFFEARGVVEVDCPILSAQASVDAHIDLIPALYHNSETRYLHSSPEYGMKRLLAEGMEDIYQLSHVFRDGEKSAKHNPEFTMVEWYRKGFNLEQMVDETIEYIQVLLGPLPCSMISYREAFLEIAGIDYLTATNEQLFHYIQQNQIPYYSSIVEEGKDALLNVILGSIIEPLLGMQGLCVLAYYPASQCALAKKRWIDGEEVAERFEVYYQGTELANGYHELTNSDEQRVRFIEANETRLKLGKKPLPLDENFLEALQKGIPSCSGVAVGFDRLMMLRQGKKEIAEVLAWGWDKA